MGLKEGAVRGGVRNVSTGVYTIPDSAIHQWRFSEGSGTTTNDSIGIADGTITGATWVSGSYTGGFALNGGVGVEVDTGSWFSDFDSINNSGIACTIETSSSSGEGIWGIRDGGVPEIYRLVMNSDGTLDFRHRSDNTNNQDIESSNSYDDGAKHRIVIQRGGNSVNDIDMYVDGSLISFNVVSNDGTLDVLNNFSGTPFKFFDYLNSGYDNFTGIIDNPIVYNNLLTSSEVMDDYNRQPWS